MMDESSEEALSSVFFHWASAFLGTTDSHMLGFLGFSRKLGELAIFSSIAHKLFVFYITAA